VQGLKTFETRSWRVHWRGPLVIHTGTQDKFLRGLPDLFARAGLDPQAQATLEFPLGGIVGVVCLTNCFRTDAPQVRTVSLAHAWEQEVALGDWRHGRYAWQMALPWVAPELLPCKGQRSMWELDPGLERALKAACPLWSHMAVQTA
jgi:activating signal cointegrator 1